MYLTYVSGDRVIADGSCPMPVYHEPGAEAPAMCAEAKNLIVGYLDALDYHDRIHPMFLAARRRNDPVALEGYRELLLEAKRKLMSEASIN